MKPKIESPALGCGCGAPLSSRRDFLKTAAVAAAAISVRGLARAAGGEPQSPTPPLPGLPIVDIHQHCTYAGRPDDRIPIHQRNCGVKLTVMLPSGLTGGCAAGIAGTEHTAAFARRYPGFVYFANENVYRPEAPRRIDRYLRGGAIGIGELKDNVPCDGQGIMRVAEVARDHGVPMLMHFQEGTYNVGFERFHRVLEKFPTVKFFAHAQTFWAHIDKEYSPRQGLYPHGPVTPGGLSDRWLGEYPNLYGDLSAWSGNAALARDVAFSADFLERHQDKFLFGSDCTDWTGVGPACISFVKLGFLKQLCRTDAIRDKILFGNAHRLLQLPPTYS